MMKNAPGPALLSFGLKKFFFMVVIAELVFFSVSLMYGFELNHVLDEMSAKEKNMNSVRFTFEQQVEFKEAGLREKVTGNAIIEKPKKIKILKVLPQEQITISNGSKMWVYTPSYKQAWVGRVNGFSNKNIIPEGFFTLENYVSELKNKFDLSLSSSSKEDQIVLQARPKQKNLGYELELMISTESWFPMKTIYISDSARIETVLSKFELNPSLPVATFQFKPPKGTDLIELN